MQYYKIIPIITVFSIISFLSPMKLFAAVDLPWSTTFNYEECTQQGQGGGIDCETVKNDGITWTWGSSGLGGNYTQVSAAANYSGGAGGNGFRSWVSDGDNQHTGPVAVLFSSKQKEVWIRWYQRYEAGFSWNQLIYDKTLYIRTDYTVGNVGTQMIPEFYGDSYIIASQNTPYGFPVSTGDGGGWTKIMGGPVSDGKFHCYEIYIKMDTNSNDGVGRLWIDGELVSENTNADWSGGDSVARGGIAFFDFHNNQKYPLNGKTMYVDYDDFAVYGSTPPNVDVQGNPFIGPLDGSGNTTPDPTPGPTPPPTPEPTPGPDAGTVLFEEKFDDANLGNRGWYDNTSPVLSSTEAIPGSSGSVEFTFPSGATAPVQGGAMRKKFSDSDSVYVDYYIKLSSSWVGSNQSYHPHMFYLLTNKDGDWTGPAYTYLTAYIEQNALHPRLAIQDGQNVDTSNIGNNLVSSTEYRSIAGCNGDSDGYGDGSCYTVGGGAYRNGKEWTASSTVSKDAWHHISAYFKLNRIVNGKGVADGTIQYWVDGNLALDYHNVMLRTAEHSDMKFNQLIIGPWIGDGSPVTQTFWIDNLMLATTPPGAASTTISAPTGLHVVPQ